MLDTEGPRMVRTQEKPGDMPFAGYNWRTLESAARQACGTPDFPTEMSSPGAAAYLPAAGWTRKGLSCPALFCSDCPE